MSALPKLIEDVAELRAGRERARAESIAAVRGLERALVEALAGERLKGVPEIAPDYAAVRARAFGSKPKNLAEPLPEPKAGAVYGREVLVVTAGGELEMAQACRALNDSLYVRSRPALDSDLLIEDVEHLSRLFEKLLGEHVERSRRTSARFGKLEAVARQISAALALA